MKCSICSGPIDDHLHPETNEVYWTQGHNAQPINDGRCCSDCNKNVVVPRRIADVTYPHEQSNNLNKIEDVTEFLEHRLKIRDGYGR